MATASGGRGLFTRQSSGLVREVSVTNALFFNTAAFIGVGVGWYPTFYSLAFVAIGTASVFTTYGIAAILIGLACILLSLIFASLTSVMPRSGGDYVFTSRIVPRIGPFVGWLESWTLAFASVAIIAFEVPVFIRNLQITGRIIGLGTGSSFFAGANSWFTDETGAVTGLPGFIAAVGVLLLIALVTFQPTRRFHRIVSTLAVLGLIGMLLMFVIGMIAITPENFAANLPRYAPGTTIDSLVKAGTDNLVIGDFSLDPSTFSFVAGIVLLNYIGFQYSAYISGEIRGNVRRGILFAVLGALVVAVFMNSVYTDFLSNRLGVNGQIGWGVLYWLGSPDLPLGQPNSLPLTATIAAPGLWPIWTLVSLSVTLFPFLLCPVYVAFLSRMQLAWSLDRQVPEWFGAVSERLRAPANAILAALIAAGVFALLQNFPILKGTGLAPNPDPNLDGKLNLVATLWFSILAAGLTWIMPGVNALLVRFTRPDLIQDAPFAKWLPVLGVVWLAIMLVLYWFAGLSPIVNFVGKLETEDQLTYLNRTGITFTMLIFGAGIVVYVIQWARNRARGIDMGLMYKELPPD